MWKLSMIITININSVSFDFGLILRAIQINEFVGKFYVKCTSKWGNELMNGDKTKTAKFNGIILIDLCGIQKLLFCLEKTDYFSPLRKTPRPKSPTSLQITSVQVNEKKTSNQMNEKRNRVKNRAGKRPTWFTL